MPGSLKLPLLLTRASLTKQYEFGQSYTVDSALERQNINATMFTSWIIENNSDVATLTSCYIKLENLEIIPNE
ncbi:MAG: hypothetical protein KAF91_13795 [Nostoc sp. TH1S01]|nr:hypothetical protein [Nostoc sp. TH1S01]